MFTYQNSCSGELIQCNRRLLTPPAFRMHCVGILFRFIIVCAFCCGVLFINLFGACRRLLTYRCNHCRTRILRVGRALCWSNHAKSSRVSKGLLKRGLPASCQANTAVFCGAWIAVQTCHYPVCQMKWQPRKYPPFDGIAWTAVRRMVGTACFCVCGFGYHSSVVELIGSDCILEQPHALSPVRRSSRYGIPSSDSVSLRGLDFEKVMRQVQRRQTVSVFRQESPFQPRRF
jgi:hypothetical protein